MTVRGAKLYTRDQISRILSIDALIQPISAAFIDFDAGRVKSPVSVLHPTEHSDLHVKCAAIEGHDLFTIKLAGTSARPLDENGSTTTGFILVFDAHTSELIATLDDRHWITDVRTAATGALLARTCASETISTVGVIGSGTQAFLQVIALSLVRTFNRVLVWSRTSGHAEKLVDRLSAALTSLDISTAPIDVVASTSDILITATSSTEPLVRSEWLHAGQHITAVGADDEFKCELFPAALDRADCLIVDSLELTSSYGDLRYAIEHSAFDLRRTVELGSVLAGKHIARSATKAITIGKLVGLGFQDLAAVEYALPRLLENEAKTLGQLIP